jgi:hypothetical protein
LLIFVRKGQILVREIVTYIPNKFGEEACKEEEEGRGGLGVVV